MALTSKIRQRRWKERQVNKRQVTVMLSEEAYDDLNRVKMHTGENYSTILDKAISSFSKHVDPGGSEGMQTVDELARFIDRQEKSLGAAIGIATDIYPPKEMARFHRKERVLKKSEEEFHLILDNSYDIIFLANLNDQTFQYLSPSSKNFWGYSAEELNTLGFKKIWKLTHPDDREKVKRHFKEFTKRVPTDKDVTIEMRMKHKTRGYHWMSCRHTLMFNEMNQPIAVVANVRDIQRRKQGELELQKLHDKLERKVNQNTVSLEQANNALKLMLKKEEEIKNEFEDKILCNVKELVLPFVDRLKTSRLDHRQRENLDILESNINKIVSPFLYSLNSKFLDLTPGEIQVANFIKDGKKTKEIADILNLSIRTIEFHRANIRKKTGLKKREINLRTHLMSIA